MRRAAILLVILLAGCGDRGWYTPSTTVEVTRKGCSLGGNNHSNDVFVNVVSERLPNGEIRCIIDTLPEPTHK